MTVFVNKGDAPLTPVQLEKRAQTYIRRSWPEQAREKSIRTADGAFDAFMATFSVNHNVNIANNTFNRNLLEYRKATERLAKYRLAEGKPAETIETPTGHYDEEGNEIMGVTVIPAIEPLAAQVEETTYDEEGNATGTIMMDNPEIVRDDAERVAAQVVVDATPQEVIDYAAS